MRFFLVLLLAFALIGNTYAAASAESRVCCASEECDVVECLAMACLPAASALLSPTLITFAPPGGTVATPTEYTDYLPDQYKVVWTPPD